MMNKKCPDCGVNLITITTNNGAKITVNKTQDLLWMYEGSRKWNAGAYRVKYGFIPHHKTCRNKRKVTTSGKS